MLLRMKWQVIFAWDQVCPAYVTYAKEIGSKMDFGIALVVVFVIAFTQVYWGQLPV